MFKIPKGGLSMNSKDIRKCFKRATSAVKHGTLGALGGVLVTSVAIPVMGLAAHGVKYMSDEQLSGYSLKNRFETAYCFDTPQEHKYYYSTPIVNGYSQGEYKTKEKYLASPYATYGTMALSGLAGAVLLGGGRVLLPPNAAKTTDNIK